MLRRAPICAKALATAVLMFVLVTASAHADVPDSINYQGILTTAGGAPVSDGNYSVTLSIYSTEVGGVALWSETKNVTTNSGLFNTFLGTVTPLPPSVFSGPNRFLGTTVSPDPEMTPRTAIVTVPYAYRVATVDGASGGTISGDILLNSTASVNALEVSQSGIGRGIRVGMNNAGSTESGLVIAMQGPGSAIGIAADGGGPAIDVVGGFGDGTVNLPGGAISSFEITDATITAADLASNSVTLAKLASNSVNSAKIEDLSILNDDVAVNEINSNRLENEPGCAQSAASASFALTNTVAAYRTATLTAPTSGYALVIASATGIILHTTGQTNTLKFGVSESATALDADQAKEWEISSGMPSGTLHQVLSAQKIFPVAAGNIDFYLAAVDAAGTSGKLLADMTLSVVFIPTAYGTVQQ